LRETNTVLAYCVYLTSVPIYKSLYPLIPLTYEFRCVKIKKYTNIHNKLFYPYIVYIIVFDKIYKD